MRAAIPLGVALPGFPVEVMAHVLRHVRQHAIVEIAVERLVPHLVRLFVGVLALTGTFGMMSGRSLARARHESGPDATADGGTSAASHCMNSSGDITIWVVPSR